MPSAILVNPIHDAQVVRGDDGMDHVEYELLVVSVVDEAVTLSSVTVFDPGGQELARIQGEILGAATQSLFAKTPQHDIPPSGAVSVDVDVVVPPGTAPERVTHRIEYTLPADTHNGLIFDDPVIQGPEVGVDRSSAIAVQPPVKGEDWLASSACCEPNVHRDLRIAVNGNRISTAETFAVDFAKVRNDRLFDGDGSQNEQFYGFGADVFAIADGTVVSVQDGKPETTPYKPMVPKDKSDYGGNSIILQIEPGVYAFYAHLQPGTLMVTRGEKVKAGATLGKVGNTGPSQGPHLHLGLLDTADPFTGRSIPFVLEEYTLAGRADLAVSDGDHLVIKPESTAISSAYPLVGSLLNFP
jgi:hypothetical protein